MIRALVIAIAIVSLAACTPPSGAAPVLPADASDASPCDVADALTSARMIRNPATGLAERVPCP